MSSIQNTNKPITLIVHGANVVGEKLTELLSAQKGTVVVIDEFSRQNKEAVKRLKSEYGIEVYDLSAVQGLSQKIKRLDYVFILLDHYLATKEKLTGQSFLSETNLVDALCKTALEQGSKVVLTTSIALHRKIVSDTAEQIDTLKGVHSQTPYTPVELQRYCENLAAEYHDQSMLNIRITRLGEVIGERIPTDRQTVLQDMIREAISKPRITIPGEGLDYAYYVHYLDAVYGIIKSIFSNNTNGEVFSLSYPEEISSLNLAYKILELNPKASEIVFEQDEEGSPPQHVYVPAKNLTKLGWTPKVSFEKALMETIGYFHQEYNVTWKNQPKPSIAAEEAGRKTRGSSVQLRSDTVTPFGKAIESVTSPFTNLFSNKGQGRGPGIKKPTAKGALKTLLVIATAILLYFGLIGPLIQLGAGGAGSYYYGKKGYDTTLSLDTDSGERYLKNASMFAGLAKSGWNGLSWISYIPTFSDFYTETALLVSSGEHLATGSYYLSRGIHPYVEYFKDFEPITAFGPSAGGGSRAYLEELEAMEESLPYIERASVEIALAREGLDGLDTSALPGSVSGRVDYLRDTVAATTDTVTTIESFAYYLPELLGKEGRQTYIVLLQNPMELRSTGGWLSSVGIVGIEHGQVRTLEVQDVYEIEGQIDEKVSPPPSMRDALGLEEWSLSLSNWSPDFPQSADSAEYFLTLSGDIIKADGVIAIDLEFIRDLIDVWGSIQVPGETEPVTSDSLYDTVIEIHREFTPGSTQKPVFLSNLANEILQETFSSQKDTWPEIAGKIAKNLDEKHIIVYFHNTAVREVLDNKGWSGHIIPKANTLYPVEWNWGGNKANHFIDRSLNVSARIQSETTVQQTLTVSYENNSTSLTYPEGDYRNFVRVYIPHNSSVTKVEGLSTVKISQDQTTGLDIVSGWITVPISGKASYTLSYQMLSDEVDNFPLRREPGGNVTFDLNIMKQPGLMADPITIDITYPEGWDPTDLTNVRRELNALVQQDNLERDSLFSLTWEK
jgi:nucleoside-diphosphate-sugar epimerase